MTPRRMTGAELLERIRFKSFPPSDPAEVARLEAEWQPIIDAHRLAVEQEKFLYRQRLATLFCSETLELANRWAEQTNFLKNDISLMNDRDARTDVLISMTSELAFGGSPWKNEFFDGKAKIRGESRTDLQQWCNSVPGKFELIRFQKFRFWYPCLLDEIALASLLLWARSGVHG